MAVTKEKKTEAFGRIKDAIASAATVVFVNFRGLTVADANQLRKELSAEEVGYTVVKKTLLRKALQEKGLSDEGELPGEIAIAYLPAQAGGDPIAPARGIAAFAKKNPEKLSIEGGIFDGAVMTRERMREIAAIPGLDTLRAQFVYMINSPLQRLAIALDQIAAKRG